MTFNDITVKSNHRCSGNPQNIPKLKVPVLAMHVYKTYSEHTHTHRQAGRQAGTQRDRQTDRDTDRQTDSETERDTDT